MRVTIDEIPQILDFLQNNREIGIRAQLRSNKLESIREKLQGQVDLYLLVKIHEVKYPMTPRPERYEWSIHDNWYAADHEV